MYVRFTFFLYYYHRQQLKSLDCHVGDRRQILLLILSEFERTDFGGEELMNSLKLSLYLKQNLVKIFNKKHHSTSVLPSTVMCREALVGP